MVKEYFKKVKLTSVILCLLYFFFGLSLIIWPNATKITIISLLGGIIVLYGIISIVNYFLYGYEPFGFVCGFMQISVGILILSFAKVLANAQILAFIFGFIFIINSIFKMQSSFDYRRLGSKTWWIEMLFGVVMFILGIVILCNPFVSEKWLLLFLGIAIIIDSIFQLVSIFVVAIKARKIKHTLRDVISGKIEPIDITDYNNDINNKN